MSMTVPSRAIGGYPAHEPPEGVVVDAAGKTERRRPSTDPLAPRFARARVVLGGAAGLAFHVVVDRCRSGVDHRDVQHGRTMGPPARCNTHSGRQQPMRIADTSLCGRWAASLARARRGQGGAAQLGDLGAKAAARPGGWRTVWLVRGGDSARAEDGAAGGPVRSRIRSGRRRRLARGRPDPTPDRRPTPAGRGGTACASAAVPA
jgi:hypothetical protein